MSLLLVDDKEALREVMARALREAGHEVQEAASAEEALEHLGRGRYDLLISDLRMPGLDGMALLGKAKTLDPDLDVLMISAQAGIEDAVMAMRLGALDFLVKPFVMDALVLKVAKALDGRSLVRHQRLLTEELRVRRGSMVGSGAAMREVQVLLRKLAATRSNALIVGESGTGKELAARAMHDWGPSAGAPFVGVHCASLAPGVLESELFGHEKGAFTGATARRSGRFEAAESGTLFLDEVSEIPLDTQVKLLRVLQERVFERVGGDKSLPLKARLIAASNKDLERLVKKGLFREDLFYRLNVVSVRLPSLRERREDIPELAQAFFERYRRELARPLDGFAPGALEALSARDWPGNVRELQNAVERAVVLSEGPWLEFNMDEPEAGKRGLALKGSLDATLGEMERSLIADALMRSEGVQSRAAKLLGVSRSALQYKLQKFGFKEGVDDPS